MFKYVMLKVLIIGGSGSLGNVLTEKFTGKYDIYIYSRGEDAQWRMKTQFPDATFIIGDISDKNRVKNTLDRVRPNYVIIAAALKHIDVCEFNTTESIKTNVIGVQNVVDAVSDSCQKQLACVLFVSTDKACSPVNVYGNCKALGEKIIIEKSVQCTSTRFVVVRYGNVLNSRGSLIPKFHSIGRDPARATFGITDQNMTRFFMTLSESVELIEYALLNGKTGHTYVPRLQSYKISDIAMTFSRIYGKPVILTGIRPGEKMHEELINYTESLRTTLPGGKYYDIAPVTDNQVLSPENILVKNYTSENFVCSDSEMILHIVNSGIF